MRALRTRCAHPCELPRVVRVAVPGEGRVPRVRLEGERMRDMAGACIARWARSDVVSHRTVSRGNVWACDQCGKCASVGRDASLMSLWVLVSSVRTTLRHLTCFLTLTVGGLPVAASVVLWAGWKWTGCVAFF